MPWLCWRCNRSEAALAEQEHQLREREAEQAEALTALEISRKTLEEAATFVKVRWFLASRVGALVCHKPKYPPFYFFVVTAMGWRTTVSINEVTAAAIVAKS